MDKKSTGIMLDQYRDYCMQRNNKGGVRAADMLISKIENNCVNPLDVIMIQKIRTKFSDNEQLKVTG